MRRQSWRMAAWCAAVIVLFVGSSTFLFYRFFNGRAVRDDRGLAVSGLRDSDLGTFSKPEFRPVVEKYLRNLEAYRQLPMRPLTANAADLSRTQEELREAVVRSLEPRDTAFAKLPAGEKDKLLKSLVERTAVLLARAAGLPNDAYLAGLGPTVMAAGPYDLETIKFVDQTYLDGKLNNAATDESQLRGRVAFDALYEVGMTHRAGASKLVGWCPEAIAFRCITYEALSDGPYDSPLFSRMSPADQNYFFGSLAQNAVIFARPPESETSVNGPITRFAEVASVVQSSDGDRFPVVFQMFYDRKRDQWYLKYAHRQVSPRMANLPQLTF